MVLGPDTAARPVVLSGPMGSGKSTLAPLVAAELGRPWVDLDDEVARIAGLSVGEIFARDGEARFRDLERGALFAALSRLDAPVIAAGGGALVERALRDAAHARGVVVGLTAPAEVLAKRAAASGERPLLQGRDVLAALEGVGRERSTAYDDVPVSFDTSLADPSALSSEIARSATAFYAPVSRESPVSWLHVTAHPWEALRRAVIRARPTRVVIVTDEHVARLYLPLARAAIDDSVLAPPIVLTPGEHAKSLPALGDLLRRLLASAVDRRSLIVTLGGGVVSDVGGFAAAIHMRGVRWIAVATSTIAMVDAAIGGKTAIDIDTFKNSAGAFHLPLATIVAPALSSTETPRNRRSGFAEALKTFAVADVASFSEAEELPNHAWEEPEIALRIIRRSASLKASIVSRDPLDTGERAILNFGHTVGHALESIGGFTHFTHGEAVALGMIAASRLGEQLGITDASVTARLQRVLARAGIPTALSKVDLTLAADAIAKDKKRDGDDLRCVLLEHVGRPVVHRVGLVALRERMASLADNE